MKRAILEKITKDVTVGWIDKEDEELQWVDRCIKIAAEGGAAGMLVEILEILINRWKELEADQENPDAKIRLEEVSEIMKRLQDE